MSSYEFYIYSKTQVPGARVLHAFWLKEGAGADAPPWLRQRGGGGDYEVKEGHPDFLQIA